MIQIKANLENINLVCETLFDFIKNKNHVIFLLYGDIGAGKTSLVKEYVKFIGLIDCVTSPTFSLMHEYENKIFHYDLYNRNLEDLLSLGILDLLEQQGIHFVEWGNKELQNILDSAFLDVNLIKIKKLNNERIYEFN